MHAEHEMHQVRQAPPMAGKHEGHSLKMFARKFWVTLVLTLPVVLLSGPFGRISETLKAAIPGSTLPDSTPGELPRRDSTGRNSRPSGGNSV